MKIATNINRDAFGGITISNLALFDWLEHKDDTIVGIEYTNARHLLGAGIFSHYPASFFSHHIINAIDIFNRFPWTTTPNIKKEWRILIETTKNVLKKAAPDIILVNGTYYSPWILAQAAHELGIPMVLRYAGVLKREVENKNFFIRRRLLAHERWIAQNANAIIFPSTLCRRVVEKEILNQPAKNAVVIPNPVQSSGTIRTKKEKRGRYAIVAIGRWTPIKNFEAFIALHQELLKEHWPHRAIMVTSYWDKRFGISETIERKDPMTQDELREFYRTVDLLVVPSHFETFCNVAAEALVHGSSILISENVGFAEVLQRAGLGRMVIKSFDDPAVVAAAVKRLAKIPLTKKERDAVARIVSPRIVHEKIINVIVKVLKKSSE